MKRISSFICLLLTVLALMPAADTEAFSPTSAPVVYIAVDGEIDAQQARYFKRALADAQTAHARAIVVHLATDGGELGAGREMLAAALTVPKDVRLVAFVDHRAYSAGALIAYGHEQIFLTKVATIGDIGVIFQGTDGKIEYAPEKIQTVVRSLLKNAAENRGWDKAKLVKMTALDQPLWKFAVTPGDTGTRWDYVIDDDLPTWLAEHPTVKREDGIQVLGKDRLLSYTASEAVADGMATALVDDLDAVYAKLGTTSAQVLRLEPTTVERVAWKLSGIAPLLAALAVLCIFLELKTPGVGLWAALAGVFGVAFFVCQFYQDLAGYPEVILAVLGVAAIAVELFIFPTGGLLLIAGAAMGMLALLLAFMPDNLQFSPGDADYGRLIGAALQRAALALAITTGGALILIRLLPGMLSNSAMAMRVEVTATSADADAGAQSLIGRRGVARTDLRPNGFIIVDDLEIGATTADGAQVDAGTAVLVTDMRFGEAVVSRAAVHGLGHGHQT